MRRMTDTIVHRGPDDDGYFFDGPVGLGMRRLSIIDLEGGSQPIANEDGSIRIVYNGEIYNYRELRRELEAAGHVFATRADTEVVVHAYEENGHPTASTVSEVCLGSRCGTRRAANSFLAVDRFGIKPLYYAPTRDGHRLRIGAR